MQVNHQKKYLRRKKMNRDICWYDIETCVANDFDKVLQFKKFKAPSNIKDKDKIEANIEAQKEKYRSKAALSPTTGKICCITAVIGDRTFEHADDDESKIISDFTDFCSAHGDVHMGGFNSANFDDRFVQFRCAVNRIKRPIPYRNKGIDLMKVLYPYGEFVSLDVTLAAMGLPPKTGAGSDVQGMYDNKEWDKLMSYCLADSMAVRDISELLIKTGVTFHGII